jgi:hypothetical protein
MKRGSAGGWRRHRIRPPSLLQGLLERIRGREQLLVRPGPGLPLLLITYPRGKDAVARKLETAFAHALPALRKDILAPYAATLAAAPAMVVVLLRSSNPCGCLGHHHPRGTESRLTRRLAADLGSDVGEIDLAYEGIRAWAPQPLSSLATGDLGGKLPGLHFEAAILTVLLHELDHLAFPKKRERDIRTTSNQLYASIMEELVLRESGRGYGMASPPPRP